MNQYTGEPDVHAMSEHVSELTLRRMMSGEAGSSAKLALLRHLAGCETCAAISRRVAEADFPALLQHFAEAEPVVHLDVATELRPYAARRLGPAESEIVASHLDDCEECRARLAAIRAASRRRRIRTYAIAASLAIAAVLSLIVLSLRQPPQRPPIAARPAPRPQPPAPPPQRAIDPEWQRLVARAVETRELPFPAVLATLRLGADVPRGPGHDAQRVSPSGVMLRDARPRFTWPADADAKSTVFVFDGGREIAHSESLRQNAWTPSKDLPRGKTLSWQVEVERGGETSVLPAPPAPPAFFRVITEGEQRELTRAEALHANEPLLLAVLYARAGLRDEALAQLRIAAQRNVPGAAQILRNAAS